MNKQSQRLEHLDLMRVIAMMMMILGHSFFDLVRPNLYSVTNFPWNIWEFLRGLTAPIFLFISGTVQVFANKRIEGKVSNEIVTKRIKTALLLIFLGYFLNFPVQKAFHIFFVNKTTLIPFLQVNILQLIGFTLIWLLVYFIFTKNNRKLGVISFFTGIIIFTLTPFVHLIDWYQYLPISIAPYFSLNKGSYFPIFPFSGFLFLGAAFGTYLEQFPLHNRAKVIIKKGLLFGLISLLLGIPLYFIIDSLHLPFYVPNKGNPGMSVIRLSLVLILLSVLVAFYEKFLNKIQFVKSSARTLGKNALIVYIVHIVILYGLPWYPGLATLYPRQFGILESLSFSFAVMFVSFGIIFHFEKIASQKKILKPLFKYGLVSIFLLLSLV